MKVAALIAFLGLLLLLAAAVRDVGGHFGNAAIATQHPAPPRSEPVNHGHGVI